MLVPSIEGSLSNSAPRGAWKGAAGSYFDEALDGSDDVDEAGEPGVDVPFMTDSSDGPLLVLAALVLASADMPAASFFMLESGQEASVPNFWKPRLHSSGFALTEQPAYNSRRRTSRRTPVRLSTTPHHVLRYAVSFLNATS